VAFGLLAITFILLVVLPAMLVVLNRFRVLWRRLFSGEQLDYREVEPAYKQQLQEANFAETAVTNQGEGAGAGGS
jgi:hypothetical protein